MLPSRLQSQLEVKGEVRRGHCRPEGWQRPFSVSRGRRSCPKEDTVGSQTQDTVLRTDTHMCEISRCSSEAEMRAALPQGVPKEDRKPSSSRVGGGEVGYRRGENLGKGMEETKQGE